MKHPHAEYMKVFRAASDDI